MARPQAPFLQYRVPDRPRLAGGGVGQAAACSGAERGLRASLLPIWVGHVTWVGDVTWVRAAAVHDPDVVDGHRAEGAARVRVRGRPGQVGLDVRRQLELRRAVTRGERAERDEDRDRVRRQVLPGRCQAHAQSQRVPWIWGVRRRCNAAHAANGAARRVGGGAPTREEVRRVHVPALRLGARVRDEHTRLLEVRLAAQQRPHSRSDARLLR